MSDFDLGFPFVQKWEGGSKVTNTPGDRGGQTYAGIARNFHPQWEGWRYIDANDLANPELSELVHGFYKTQFWEKGKCDKLRFPVNIAHFDACVQHGPVTASKFLQRAADVEDDGDIGPQTLGAVITKNQESLCRAMIKERTKFYRLIVEHDSTQARFLQGWMNRITDLKKFIGITQEIA